MSVNCDPLFLPFFGFTVDSYYAEIEDGFETDKQNLEMQFHKMKSQMPGKVLHMKMSDLQNLCVQNFSDIFNSPVVNTNFSSLDNFQISCTTTKQSTSEEGYNTHEETNKGSRSSSRQFSIPKITGPFLSAQIKKRRSRSAQSSIGGVVTPQVQQLVAPQGNRNVIKRTVSGLLSSRQSR